MNQLMGSNIPFFIKGLALHNASEVENAKSRLFLLLKVMWHPAHDIPGEKPKVYDATSIIKRYHECISHYVRKISQIIEKHP
jgi:hypothetical protein